MLYLSNTDWKGRIHRIWSTDWFYNPRKETERLRSFLEQRRLVSAAEESDEQDEAEVYVLEGKSSEETDLSDDLSDNIVPSISSDHVFVEVGDQVTYCFVSDPNHRQSVLIVDGESNAKMAIVNEQAPLAWALLGLSSGDAGDLEVNGQKARQLHVLKIQRQEQLAV